MLTYASSALGALHAVILNQGHMRHVVFGMLSDILDEHSFMLGFSWFAGVKGKRIIEYSTLYRISS